MDVKGTLDEPNDAYIYTYSTPDYALVPQRVNNCVTAKPRLILGPTSHYNIGPTLGEGLLLVGKRFFFFFFLQGVQGPGGGVGSGFSSFSTFGVGLRRGGDKGIGDSAAPVCLALDDLGCGNLSPRSLAHSVVHCPPVLRD